MTHTSILARNMLKWAPDAGVMRCEVLQEGQVGLGNHTRLSGVINAWSIRYLRCKQRLGMFQRYAGLE